MFHLVFSLIKLYKMDWKQKIVITFTNLKGKKNFFIWIAGFAFLSLVLPYALLVNHDNSRKLNAMLEDMDALKRFISAKNFELTFKPDMQFSDKQEATRIRNRKKRAVGKFKDAENNLNPSLQGAGGAVYIRWGRTQCPDNYTELVYNGIAGGSFFAHTGAATNHQCLPIKPDWGHFTDGGGNAYMYGMEYEDSMSSIMDMSNVQKGIHNHNVPCAVCRSNIRTSSLIIPAKNICYEGWNLEYDGYLMAGHVNHKASTQYICVDKKPEADPAGYRDEDGALLYKVTAQCGSLPCPRYVQNRELTCVVCTR